MNYIVMIWSQQFVSCEKNGSCRVLLGQYLAYIWNFTMGVQTTALLLELEIAAS